jgi:hypothetical protein
MNNYNHVQKRPNFWTKVLILRADSHRVPSPTHVSKSQHGHKVPTVEPQEIVKIWLVIIKCRVFIIFMQKYLWDLC